MPKCLKISGKCFLPFSGNSTGIIHLLYVSAKIIYYKSFIICLSEKQDHLCLSEIFPIVFNEDSDIFTLYFPWTS